MSAVSHDKTPSRSLPTIDAPKGHTMSEELSGKTALITGSTSGIGRAIADTFATLGAHVIVTGRDTNRGDAAVAEIRATGAQADFIVADLNDLSNIGALGAKALEIGGGRVDILVNNAGIYPFTPVSDVTEEAFDQVYDTNVKAVFFLTQALLPAMVEHGDGAIVNFSTGLANRGVAGGSVYSSSKGAIESLTRAWAAEFGPSGVRVNTISPGVIITPGTDAVGSGVFELIKGDPAGRPGQPDDVALAVAFLVTDASRYLHGITLPVDGGALAAL
jgi:NAD(P)-dependent dehydrogenase (short-subunit alcohol dehydrogenase family)